MMKDKNYQKEHGQDCYILSDQPTTCGMCGARTSFDEDDGVQSHRCLNPACGYEFIAVDER